MTEVTPWAIYCDGGVLGKNPSPVGGTWAWCWVSENDRRIRKQAGVVTPSMIGLPKVTNNVTELLAAVYALQSVPFDWQGTLHTDSQVTLYRLTTSSKFNGVPLPLVEATLHLRKYHRYKVKLIKGHATDSELRTGIAEENGLPTSRHNSWTDAKCNQVRARFEQGRFLPPEAMTWGPRLST